MLDSGLNSSKKIIIGPKSVVSFSDYKNLDIPAKVDTGAYRSSVWASDIKEDSGKLSFKLFDKTTPWYSGKIIRTKDYAICQVKNSFGHMERRYKVRLRVEIGGKLIETDFTLANRVNNRYPVLIGRKTLRGRFIVDVSHKFTHEAIEALREFIKSRKLAKSSSSLPSKKLKKGIVL